MGLDHIVDGKAQPGPKASSPSNPIAPRDLVRVADEDGRILQVPVFARVGESLCITPALAGDAGFAVTHVRTGGSLGWHDSEAEAIDAARSIVRIHGDRLETAIRTTLRPVPQPRGNA